MTDIDLGKLNSATKYPSILTYHALDPASGRLYGDTPQHLWEEPAVLTEKVDGTNGRVIVLDDGDWLIGSREELLYAKGDRIVPLTQGIVPVLLPLAPQLVPAYGLAATVFFFEVYGHKITGAAKQYTGSRRTGARLFDVAGIPADALDWEREKISSWRESGGQQFAPERGLVQLAELNKVDLVPRLGAVPAAKLPQSVEDMTVFLRSYVTSNAGLDDGAQGRSEGLVLRTGDRSVIAKARFQDYERTLRSAAGKKPARTQAEEETSR